MVVREEDLHEWIKEKYHVKSVWIDYDMGGNTITVKTLDLNCEFMEISQQLNGIVEENFA